MSIFKRKIETEHTTTKAFKYEKGGVILAFNLRVDMKEQLVSFEQLLEAALKEVREEIQK